ncbi:Prenylcysteine [Aspergillus sp. HF37]|nr:Prenylcysteine [Aspergillus sp. HF37]
MASPGLYFRLLLLYCIAALLFLPLSNAADQQPLRTAPERAPKRVAVIGAGAGGSSSAYHLRKYADACNRPLNITVFERSSYIGGRSTTVNVLDDPAHPVELGASIFVQANQHLVNASRELGLTVHGAGHGAPRESAATLGIWDGRRFVFTLTDSYDWWNMARLLWRYGWAPVRTQRLMRDTVARFLRLYAEPVFPFRSLTRAAGRMGLLGHTAAPGATFLAENGVSPDFAREVVQASTRVNYGQNIALIHGLEAMVCMAAEGAMAVEGGNWRIFEGMLKAALADVRLDTAVQSIERNADDTLTLTSSTAAGEQREDVFDDVVLAAPLQSSNLDINRLPLIHTPDEIPYVNLHVTLFSSPHRISPRFFGLDDANSAPETVLTTLPRDADLGSRRDGVGPAGFWSISTLQTIPAPSNTSTTTTTSNDGGTPKHYVYKIFSPQRPTASFIARVLGIQPSNTSTSTSANDDSSIGDLPKSDISWFHEKLWNPYPFLYPRVTFDEPELARNVWYTSGIEGFISTMETSALMGRNVAALVSEGWVGRTAKEGSGGSWWERTEL